MSFERSSCPVASAEACDGGANRSGVRVALMVVRHHSLDPFDAMGEAAARAKNSAQASPRSSAKNSLYAKRE